MELFGILFDEVFVVKRGISEVLLMTKKFANFIVVWFESLVILVVDTSEEAGNDIEIFLYIVQSSLISDW